MKRILKKIKTLFQVDPKWAYRFLRKRAMQRIGHLKTRLSGRLYVEVDIDGTRIKLSTLTPYHHSIAQSIRQNNYEPRPMVSWLRQISRGGGTSLIYDIGGFNGIYGLVAALRAPRARVVIFEPDATNAKEIRNSIILNNLSNCRVEEAAISDHAGNLFFTQGGSTGEQITNNSALGTSVRTLALKDLPHADCMKMDIEGTEEMALRGLDYTSTILLETHPLFLPRYNDSIESLMQLIKDKGFTVTEIDRRGEDQKHLLLTAGSSD